MHGKKYRIFVMTVALSVMAAGPALAAEKQASKEETIGVGMGATVGALAGGPVGLVLGAAIGAKLGDNYHRKADEVATLDRSLRTSQSRVSELEGHVDALNAGMDRLNDDLQRMHSTARPELLQLLQAGIAMDLLFRTGEDVLPDGTRARLGELAASVAALPDVQVQLDGFADQRGDSNYNHELSARRAEFVRQVLLDGGVPAERISAAAHGESPAADDSPDSYALERKVSLTLFVGDVPSLAANPD